eukprot:6093171-Pyramimonas_sp.AAC.1
MRMAREAGDHLRKMTSGSGNARPPHPHATSLGCHAPPRPPGTTRGERSHPQNTCLLYTSPSPRDRSLS